jgi:uncharacterized protein (UPF0332 family)
VIPDEKEKPIAAELARGDEARRAAQVLLREGLLADSISRAYCAVLHYARALLLSVDEEPETHQGVLRRFSVQFVKSGAIGTAEGKILSRLLKFRDEADYGADAHYTAEGVTGELAEVDRFRAAVVKRLGS